MRCRLSDEVSLRFSLGIVSVALRMIGIRRAVVRIARELGARSAFAARRIALAALVARPVAHDLGVQSGLADHVLPVEAFRRTLFGYASGQKTGREQGDADTPGTATRPEGENFTHFDSLHVIAIFTQTGRIRAACVAEPLRHKGCANMASLSRDDKKSAYLRAWVSVTFPRPSSTRTMVPRPGAARIVTRPSCRATTSATKLRPRPLPPPCGRSL
ncbi:hypothetical protein PANO111632_08720 [Paracoccus nototheniae]